MKVGFLTENEKNLLLKAKIDKNIINQLNWVNYNEKFKQEFINSVKYRNKNFNIKLEFEGTNIKETINLIDYITNKKKTIRIY